MKKIKISDWLKIDDIFTSNGFIWRVIAIRDKYVIATDNIGHTYKFEEKDIPKYKTK